MSDRVAFVSVALLIACGAAVSQQPTPPPVVLPSGPNIPAVNPPLPPPTVVVPVSPPAPSSVDDLLNQLERVQAEKAALEKKEQELKAAIRKKLDAQAERLKKLGIAPKEAKEKEPDRVGRIIIEGNTKTPDKKILDKLEFCPGQLLHYPALDAARARLEKAGFRGVTVEVVPGELDANYKDVRVKVDESKPMPELLPPG